MLKLPVSHFGFPRLPDSVPCSIQRLGGQILGRSILGIVMTPEVVYDQQYGCPWPSDSPYQAANDFDIPDKMSWASSRTSRPGTPIGARGIGEPPVGGGCAAILNALQTL